MPLPSKPEFATSLRLRAGVLLAFVTALLTGLLGGCTPLVIGGATVGAAAAYDRRPYYVFIEDQEIELRGLAALKSDRRVNANSRIAVTSYNRSALLTGQAESPEVANLAAKRISELPKVARVIDQITIGPNISLAQESRDTYLTSRVKLSLVQTKVPGFDASRVKVVTEDSVVYLLGLLSQAEADAVTEQARYVPGVTRVVKLFEYR